MHGLVRHYEPRDSFIIFLFFIYSLNLSLLQILAPSYSIFPVSEADQVFRKVSQAQIKGRAILQVRNSCMICFNVYYLGASDVEGV